VLIFSLIGYLAITTPAAQGPASQPADAYTVKTIEGWKVHVSKKLPAAPDGLGEKVLKLIGAKLFEINRTVPPKALIELQKVPIWLELNSKVVFGAYHPSAAWLKNNARNPAMARGIEIGNARRALSWSLHQPSFMLHELAHAYHHRHLGFGNKEVIEAYKRAVESKSYDKVLHCSGRTGKAYAIKNPKEYFAELSEAYFGVNDFYPFVRAEVRKHDPQMYELLRKLWKEAPVSAARRRPKPKRPEAKPSYTPTSGYELRKIEGWTHIYIHKDLLTKHRKIGDEVIKVLSVKLYDVSRTVPPKALTELRKVPIWMEYHDHKSPAGCFHPSRRWLVNNGLNPDKTRCVEFGDAHRFLRGTLAQPSVVLHELTHAYHTRVLSDGNRRRKLKEGWERITKSGRYGSVLHHSGRNGRAYALKNSAEYFAELSEAYFGANDFYPFVRAEVKQHDPETYKLIEELWGVK